MTILLATRASYSSTSGMQDPCHSSGEVKKLVPDNIAITLKTLFSNWLKQFVNVSSYFFFLFIYWVLFIYTYDYDTQSTPDLIRGYGNILTVIWLYGRNLIKWCALVKRNEDNWKGHSRYTPLKTFYSFFSMSELRHWDNWHVIPKSIGGLIYM